MVLNTSCDAATFGQMVLLSAIVVLLQSQAILLALLMLGEFLALAWALGRGVCR